MPKLPRTPLFYMTASFILLLIALPLVSIGSTAGPRALLWIGLIALALGGMVPPLQRLLASRKTPT